MHERVRRSSLSSLVQIEPQTDSMMSRWKSASRGAMSRRFGSPPDSSRTASAPGPTASASRQMARMDALLSREGVTGSAGAPRPVTDRASAKTADAAARFVVGLAGVSGVGLGPVLWPSRRIFEIGL